MTRGAQLLALALAAVGLALVAGRPGAARAQQPPNPPTLPTLPAAVPVCPGPPPLGAARCHAQRRTDRPQPKQTTGVAGLDPADLRAAYALGPLPLAGATVAPTAPVVAIV